MMEIIQHFLLQNSTILHIYTSIFGTLGCTVFIQETFLFINAHIYTCMHMHTAHRFTRTDSCEKVSLRLLPKSHQKSSQSTLVLFTPPSPCFCLFRLLFYAIQNSKLPISTFKFSLPTLLEISCHLSMERKELP